MSAVDAPRPVRRPLGSAEVEFLEARLREAESRARAGPRGAIAAGAGVTAVLWALTLLASDAPAWVVTLFWLAVGGAITTWVRRERIGELAGTVAPLRSALRRREAEEFRVQATAFAELEEVEDEGAAYAFQIAPDRLLFLAGQEFYATDAFPALSFSLVYPLTEEGALADLIVSCDGPRAVPARVVPRERKRMLEDLPETMEVRPGTIETLESALGAEA